jgi:hypothetical protein
VQGGAHALCESMQMVYETGSSMVLKTFTLLVPARRQINPTCAAVSFQDRSDLAASLAQAARCYNC